MTSGQTQLHSVKLYWIHDYGKIESFAHTETEFFVDVQSKRVSVDCKDVSRVVVDEVEKSIGAVDRLRLTLMDDGWMVPYQQCDFAGKVWAGVAAIQQIVSVNKRSGRANSVEIKIGKYGDELIPLLR